MVLLYFRHSSYGYMDKMGENCSHCTFLNNNDDVERFTESMGIHALHRTIKVNQLQNIMIYYFVAKHCVSYL